MPHPLLVSLLPAEPRLNALVATDWRARQVHHIDGGEDLSRLPGGQHPMAEAVRSVPLFQHLPPALVHQLAQRAQVRRCGRDDVVANQGRADNHLYVLLKGRAHAERTGENGRVVLLDVLEPGACIGERSLLDGEPHDATVRCVVPCDMLVLRGEDILQCQAGSIEFSQAWMRALVQQLRQANRRILSMSLDGVRDRVIWRLNEWSEPTREGQRVVSNRIGRNELARMVGASREMVCRVLRGLQQAGAIELRPDRSILLKTAAPD